MLDKNLVTVFTSESVSSVGIPPFILAVYRTELPFLFVVSICKFCTTLFAIPLGIRVNIISCDERLNRTEGHIYEGGYVL